MLDLVALAARRREVHLELDRDPTPTLAATALDGWQPPWVTAVFAWLAIQDAADERRAAAGRWLGASDGSCGLELHPFRPDPARIARLTALAPGCEVERTHGGAVLVLPAAWLDRGPRSAGRRATQGAPSA